MVARVVARACWNARGRLATGHLVDKQVHRLELLGVLAERGVGNDDLVDADFLESGDDVAQLRRGADDYAAR